MARFGRLTEVHHKGAVDLVTEADRHAESHLLEGLHSAFPGDGLEAEEGGTLRDGDGRWRWIVDPLDGTTNFVHGLAHFGVSLGLLLEDVPVAGIVHVPPTGDTYHAAEGQGAWCEETPIHVTAVASLGDALLATGFPYDRRERAEELLRPVRRALEQGRGIRRNGAAALDLVDVARGVFGGFWEQGLAPWDMAAGVVLVREAGGQVTGYGGRPLDLNHGDVVATNGLLHDAVLGLLDGDA